MPIAKSRHVAPAVGVERMSRLGFSEDTMGYVDGLNAYAFVGDNPINHSDPTGLKHILLSHVRQIIQIDSAKLLGKSIQYTYAYLQFTVEADCDDVTKKIENLKATKEDIKKDVQIGTATEVYSNPPGTVTTDKLALEFVLQAIWPDLPAWLYQPQRALATEKPNSFGPNPDIAKFAETWTPGKSDDAWMFDFNSKDNKSSKKGWSQLAD